MFPAKCAASGVSGRDVQLTLEQARPSCRATQAAGSFGSGSRWPQALVQTRERLRLRSFALATWPSCRGPRQPTASELAVVPSTTPSALNSNAWPARPRRVLSRHNVGSKFLRAFYCVPSHADERAQHTRHASRGSGGAALTLETSAVFQTGPSVFFS